MIISFDFDDTLSRPEIFEIAKTLRRYNKLYIVTSRYRDYTRYPQHYGFNEKIHDEIYVIADKLRIKKERVVFTDMQYKAEMLDKLNVDIHFDDNSNELIYAAKIKAKVKIVLV